MDIRKIIISCFIAIGLTSGFVATPAVAKDRKVVMKKKHKRHRHKVGLRHIGRGTKHKTVVKTSH